MKNVNCNREKPPSTQIRMSSGMMCLIIALSIVAGYQNALALKGTPKSDLTEDGIVNFEDMAVLAEDWMQSGQPPGIPDCNLCTPYYTIDPNDPNTMVDYFICVLKLITCCDWHLLEPNERALLQGYHDLLYGEGVHASWGGFFETLRDIGNDTGQWVYDNLPEQGQDLIDAANEYIPPEVGEFEDLVWGTFISGEEAATDMTKQAMNEMQDTIMKNFNRWSDYIPPEVFEVSKDTEKSVREGTEECMNVIGFRRRLGK